MTNLIDLIPARIDINKNHPFNTFNLVIYKSVAKNIQYIVNYECDTFSPDMLFPHKLFHPNVYDEDFETCLTKLMTKLKEEGYV